MSVCLFMYHWMLYNVYVSRLVLFKTVVIEWKVWFTTVPLKALSDQIGLEMFMFLILTNNYLQFWFFYKLDLRKIYCCTESQPYVELSVLITCQAKRRRYLLYFLSDDTVVNLIFYIFYLMVPLWIWSSIYSIWWYRCESDLLHILSDDTVVNRVSPSLNRESLENTRQSS